MEDTWMSKIPDGRSVTYTYESIMGGPSSATAEIEGTNLMYVHNNVSDGMSRGQVEILFRADLDGKT